MKKIMIVVALIGLLAGCSDKGVRIENTTAYSEEPAKNIFQRNEHVKLAVVLLDEKELLAGVRVNTFSRFQKKKIASKLEKQLKKQYPDVHVTVSADSKVLLETEKLIKKGKKEDYKKKVKEIKSIEKEQT